MKLNELLKSIPMITLPNENPTVVGITNNDKEVKKGFVFVCIKGYTFNGHEFASQAVENGAVAMIAQDPVDVDVPVIYVKDTKRILPILANQFYDKPTEKLQLIGITGTNGKTTTSHIIDQIFQQAEKATGLIGTMYMKIKDQVIETKNTTPDSVVLQSLFHQMVESEVDTAIMEVSSHALVQGRVLGCDYDVAVFTNLSQDHLDYHHTMEEYLHAKGLLFSRLGNTFNQKQPKFAILNADDPSADYLMGETAVHLCTYGIDTEADFMAKNIRLDGSGTRFTLITPAEEVEVTLQLIGKFNVYNVLAAVAAAYVSKIHIDVIIQAIEGLKGVAGRFEPVNAEQDFSVIVDYAHTPDSLENVLLTIKQFAEKRIFAIVGCGGDRDRTKRPLMAQIACKHATNPIFTSDNPRSEEPEQILKDMTDGVKNEAYTVITDRANAIEQAIFEAEKGDVVLIAGKGHETYQIIKGQVLDFDDRKVAYQAIMKKKIEDGE